MTDPIETLLLLLTEERRALAAGELGLVADLVSAKQAALAQLPERAVPAQRLAALKAEAERVQILLAASLDGIAAARTRIGTLQQIRSGLTTYDSLGRKANMPTALRRGVERKA
jgi:hypothetical protein